MRITVPSKSNALSCAYDIVTRNPGFAEAMKFEKGTESFCFVQHNNSSGQDGKELPEYNILEPEESGN